jgi:hypothetical protein
MQAQEGRAHQDSEGTPLASARDRYRPVRVECRADSELRLSALVNLQIQPLKRIFLSGHQKFPVQFQLFCTRRPLYLKLHTN